MDSQLRKLQTIELEILRKFISLCEKHNLRYCAIGGTFLGAVRHKGFIPWDDDIDIGMPRPDYDRFLTIVESELPKHLKAINAFTSPAGLTYFTQILDTRTKVVSHSANLEKSANVWVDIFPLDGVPYTFIRKQWYLFKLLYLRMRIQFSLYDQNVHQFRLNRPFHERLLIKFCDLTKFGQNDDTFLLMARLDRFLKKQNFDSCEYALSSLSGYKLKTLFHKDMYENLIFYQFEDILIPGPLAYDRYLKQYYGDYMKLPDKDQAKMNHSIEIIKL